MSTATAVGRTGAVRTTRRIRPSGSSADSAQVSSQQVQAAPSAPQSFANRIATLLSTTARETWKSTSQVGHTDAASVDTKLSRAKTASERRGKGRDIGIRIGCSGLRVEGDAGNG